MSKQLTVANIVPMAPIDPNEPLDYNVEECRKAAEPVGKELGQRRRGYVFTWNNYTADTEQYIQLLAKDSCSYCCYGREIAPTTGTPHLQGYLEFTHARYFKAVCSILRGAWIGVRRGTTLQAANYAKKTLNTWEWGTRPEGSGKRNDIQTVRSDLSSGKSIVDITEGCSYQTYKYAESLMKYKEAKRNWKPIVVWIYGPSGCGKTRHAQAIIQSLEDPNPWESGEDLKWWDGYDAHETVLIDEFRSHHCSISKLLRILDRYPYMVAFKGGFRQLLAKYIIVTCPDPPHRVYGEYSLTGKSRSNDAVQIVRRIDIVIRMDQYGQRHYEKDGIEDTHELRSPYNPQDGWTRYNDEYVNRGSPSIDTSNVPSSSSAPRDEDPDA